MYSQKDVSLINIRFALVYGCVGVGQPSSSVVMGIEADIVKDSSLPKHISFPPRVWRSAVRRVAMLRTITEGKGIFRLGGSGRRVLKTNVGIWWQLV